MPVLGTPVTWKFAGSLALGGLALASLGMALGWAAWLTGVWWGVSFALGTLALVGMLRPAGPKQPAPEPDVAPLTEPLSEPEQPESVLDAEKLIESVGDPVIVISPDGLVLFANAQASRLLGLTRRMTGRYVEEVITKAELLDRLSRGRRGETWRGSFRLPTPGGVRVCDASIVPVTPDVPAGVVATLRDITELDGAIKLKTDFVANASHELRTPIAAIKAAAETLSIAHGDEAMRTRLVGMIESHVLRLEEMVSDLLDLSRLESEAMKLDIRPVSLPLLVDEMAQLLADLCQRRRVTIEHAIDPAIETLHTDRRLLVLIAKNLIENAAKFTAEGSAVRVEARPGEQPGSCELRVRDRGPGIPLAQQQRIFERFYQVDPARSGTHRGTGLGLAIVKHAARLLEGSVEVESLWQQGTTMIVRLPPANANGSSLPAGDEND